MIICTRKVSEKPRNGETFPEGTSWYSVLHARMVSGVEESAAALLRQPPHLLDEVGVDELRAVEDVVLALGFRLCLYRVNATSVWKYAVVVERQEAVYARRELLHGESVLPLYLHLDVVEVCGDGTLQAAYLLLVEVVLRNGQVRLQHPAVGGCALCAQAHVRLRVVCAGVYYLGGGLAGYGVVEAVLHHGVEVASGRRVAVVVGAALGVDVRYLLPDAPLACTD